MRILNEKEMNTVNGGVTMLPLLTKEENAQKIEKEAREKWLKWVEEEKQKLEGLADIRMRAGEAALKAAMRVQHAEMEIKAAQRAVMGLD